MTPIVPSLHVQYAQERSGRRYSILDPITLLRQSLEEDRREPDNLLHCSSDLIGSLRHSQLRLAGAPQLTSSITSDIRLMTGTMWHRYFNQLLIDNGVTAMHEVVLNSWLPEGWGGTADWLIWEESARAFQLWDLKTTKGTSLEYIHRDGAKQEHVWQTSAYWHALRNGKFPLLNQIKILYLPMDNSLSQDIEPAIVDILPLPKEQVWSTMEERWSACKNAASGDTAFFAPPQPRIQRLFLDKKSNEYELKLVPHWSTAYCPFPDEFCDCNTQGVTKIGSYSRLSETGTIYGNDFKWIYKPRKGYENYEPLLRPAS